MYLVPVQATTVLDRSLLLMNKFSFVATFLRVAWTKNERFYPFFLFFSFIYFFLDPVFSVVCVFFHFVFSPCVLLLLAAAERVPPRPELNPLPLTQLTQNHGHMYIPINRIESFCPHILQVFTPTVHRASFTVFSSFVEISGQMTPSLSLTLLLERSCFLIISTALVRR